MPQDNPIDQADSLLANKQPAEALVLYDEILAKNPNEAAAWQGRGRALNNLKRPKAAEQAFTKALEIDPGNAASNNYLGHVLRVSGRPAEAIGYFRAAIATDENMAIAHYNLGTVLGMTGDYDGAVAALEQSLQRGRHSLDALLNLGELYQFLERYRDAAAAYSRAVELAPDDATPAELLGDLWYSLGRVESAREAYSAALSIDSSSLASIAGMALLHELWGDIDEGLALLDNAKTTSPRLQYARARLLRRKGELAAAQKILEDLRSAEHPLASDPRLFFTLGELHDEQGNYAAAFAAFRRANDLKPAPFDAVAHNAGVDAQIRFFSSSRLASLPRARLQSEQPVFIVGMPRSGTSLVEQILASHESVHAGGERFEMLDVLQVLGSGYPQDLGQLTETELNALAQRYLKSYGSIGNATCWTDKLPKNFLHLGLISLLFPNARIVYCRRDARDTGLSVYFQNMNFRSDPWTSRLEHIAAYSGSCERIMTHWQAVLSLPLLEVNYESMVATPEPEIRRLLGFLDLPWEPRCLRFHRTKRLVNTASYAQVRQPMYQSSVGRWKNYRNQLGPLSRSDVAG